MTLSINLNKFCPTNNLKIDNICKIYQNYFENKEINDMCSNQSPIECTIEYYQVIASDLKLDHDIHFKNDS